MADKPWFRPLLVFGLLVAVVGIGLGLWELFSTYVHPLPRIPTVGERREAKDARLAKETAREKYLKMLRDVLVDREERATAELGEARFTTRLGGFSRWVRTTRQGINEDVRLHKLLEAWDPLLTAATAYEQGMQATWDAIDYVTDPQSIPPFGKADRNRLVALIAAIVEARRAVEALLNE